MPGWLPSLLGVGTVTRNSMQAASLTRQHHAQSSTQEWGNKRWAACCCRCDYVDFDVAVFTNIAKDKVDAFGGIKQYLDAQGSLFLKLQDDSRQRAVINTDGAFPLLALACRHMYIQDIGM